MRISDWSSDVCSADLGERAGAASTLVDTLQRALLRLGVALGERIGIERVAAGGERAQGADAACNAFTHESVAFGRAGGGADRPVARPGGAAGDEIGLGRGFERGGDIIAARLGGMAGGRAE